jgi:hypothetical protein
MLLLVTDTHFDYKPENEYRWELFEHIRSAIIQYGVTDTYHLGDLTDQADRFPGAFVNRLITELRSIGARAPWRIIKGNHEYILNSPAFWEFLSEDAVTYITKPIERENGLLLLPFTKSPQQDWANLDFSQCMSVFTHATRTGTIGENGFKLRGRDYSIIPNHVKVYSGDVHVKQTVDNWVYVGAPYHENYGDNYSSRMLILNPKTFDIEQEIPLNIARKLIIQVKSIEELAAYKVGPKDQVRLTYDLQQDDQLRWGEINAQINQWAAETGVQLTSSTPVVAYTKVDGDPNLNLEPENILREFAISENTNQDLLQIGLDLLQEVLSTYTVASTTEFKTITSLRMVVDRFKSIKHLEWDFPTTPGLKFIVGSNQQEPRLGANGAGKSSWITDSICFCLYGKNASSKPYSLRASDLIMSGETDTSVSYTFDINGKIYNITRTSPPNRILLNGQEVKQQDVDNLVGGSCERFIQSKVFGQRANLFVDLSIPDRGDLLDDVCDLGFWLRAADNAKKHYDNKEKELEPVAKELTYTKGLLDSLRLADDITEREALWDSERLQRIDQIVEQIETIETQLALAENQIAQLKIPGIAYINKLFADIEVHQTNNQKIHDKKNTIKFKLDRLEQDADFFSKHDTCPVCTQLITEEFTKDRISHIEQEQTTLQKELIAIDRDIEHTRQNICTASNIYKKANEERERLLIEQTRLTEQINIGKRALSNLEAEIDTIGSEINPYTEQKDNYLKRRKEIEQTIIEHSDKIAACESEMANFDFWKQGFRRVRFFCLKRVLQQLNFATASTLPKHGLIGWAIEFLPEIENKSGTTKSGVHIIVSSPTRTGKYETFSPGEGQRARMCITDGFAAVVEQYSRVKWNLAVYDEPTNWLSPEGVEDVLECLQAQTETEQKSIFIIDHRALSHAGFSEVWQVVKDADGSRLVQIRG